MRESSGGCGRFDSQAEGCVWREGGSRCSEETVELLTVDHLSPSLFAAARCRLTLDNGWRLHRCTLFVRPSHVKFINICFPTSSHFLFARRPSFLAGVCFFRFLSSSSASFRPASSSSSSSLGARALALVVLMSSSSSRCLLPTSSHHHRRLRRRIVTISVIVLASSSSSSWSSSSSHIVTVIIDILIHRHRHHVIVMLRSSSSWPL